MKLPALLKALYHDPALILPSTHAGIRQLIEHRLEHSDKPFAREPGQGVCGSEVEVDQMEIIDGVALIPMGGVLGQDISPFDRGDGAVDTLDVRDELDLAEADDTVRGAILLADSPGGMYTGLPETAARVAEFSKPILCFSRGTVASAMYYIAAACDGNFGTHSSRWGSISVYSAVLDYSALYANAGVKVELFASGKYKGMGYPGTSLTHEQKQLLLDEVAQLKAEFVRHVRDNRGEAITDDTMEGQMFLAPEALDRGLIDGIVRDISEVTALI